MNASWLIRLFSKFGFGVSEYGTLYMKETRMCDLTEYYSKTKNMYGLPSKDSIGLKLQNDENKGRYIL
jgi:hypothetical protein